MKELNDMLNQMKKHVEETFGFYVNKDKWEPQDLKCAKEAAELYDKLQTIQMNTGVWENINRDGEFYDGTSYGRYPRISYGDDRSYKMGRPMSRGDLYHDDRYYDERWQRHDGVSTHSIKDQAIHKLEKLMDNAKTEYEREEIRKMIMTIEEQKR